MPTNQPNNAATEPLPDNARDDATAASVVSDEGLDDPAGGGGLGGAAAASPPLAGTGAAPRGTAPNSPIDVPVPAADRDAEPPAQAEAQRRATQSAPAEPHPSSQ